MMVGKVMQCALVKFTHIQRTDDTQKNIRAKKRIKHFQAKGRFQVELDILLLTKLIYF